MKYLTIIFLVLNFTFNAGAQDWPNLEKYQAQNEKLSMEETPGNRVVFMGNSITEGWVNMSPDFFKNNNYVGRGISGQTTPQMLVRFRQDVIALNPAAVTIMAGTNDIAGNTGPSSLEMIMDNLKGMAEIANDNGIKVVLCSVTPAFDYPWRPGLKPNEKIPALNEMIQTYCAEKGFVYCDYFLALTDGNNGLRKNLGDDGVHPNKIGYDIMEPLIHAAILEALKN